MLDTTGEAMKFLSLMAPSTGTIVSISTLPSGTQLQESALMHRPEKPQMPWIAYYGLNLLDAVSKFRARRWGVDYQYIFLESSGEDLRQIASYVDEGLLKPVVGFRAELKKIENVRKIAGMVYAGKGGLGKAIIAVR